MLMLSRLAAVLINLIFLATAVIAVPVNHEITSVSRIVGESPQDMSAQFRNDYTLQDAALFQGSSVPVTFAMQNVLDSQFSGFSTMGPTWVFANVKDKLTNNKNNLLVMMGNTGTPYTSSKGTQSDITSWNLNKNNIFAFNSKFAGLHIPGYHSFTSRLSKSSTYVAPMSYTSEYFVKSFVCNIGKFQPIGEVFRQARNNYYVNTHRRSEFLGLTLLSYALYGSPEQNIWHPSWNAEERSEECAEYNEVFGTLATAEVSTTQVTPGVFKRTYTINIGDPEVKESEDLAFVETQLASTKDAIGELMTPSTLHIAQFPLNTVISSTKLIGFSNPAELTVNNLAEWNGTGLQERTCFANTESAYAEFSNTITDQSIAVIAYLDPVDLLDCENGGIRVYRTATYEVEYSPISPVRIMEIEHPESMAPGQAGTINVKIENTGTSPAQGLFVLSDETGTISIVNTTTTMGSYNMEMIAPQRTGQHRFTVSFVQDDNVKTTAEFDMQVDDIIASLNIPNDATTHIDVTLEIASNLPGTIGAVIEDALLQDGTEIESSSKNVELSPGQNTFTLSYDLERGATPYELEVNIAYLEKNKVLSGIISTNRPPIIEQGNIIMNEGETLNLSPTYYDPDGDALVTEIETLASIGNGHTFTFDESGQYEAIFRANDGYITIEKQITIFVENVNRPPVLTVPEVVEGHEGAEISVQAVATDPDNENSVHNDDNTLTMVYAWPLDENGKWIPSFEASGNMTVLITVSDGEFTVTKSVILSIANVNRPPNLNNLSDITISEGEFVDLWVARDPDNENGVMDDDHGLQMYFAGGPDGGPLNHYGRWQTDYDDSGVFNMTVQVDDYEFSVGKVITLTVQNVNRPPQILAPDVVYASGTVDLSQYIYDPDNANSVTNDDNVLTISYGTPFDENGRWTPPQPDSAASTTITISDGEFTVSKNIMVMVDVGGVSTQTPPLPIQESDEPEAPETPEEEPITPEDPSPLNDGTSSGAVPAPPEPQQSEDPPTPKDTQPAPEQIITIDTTVQVEAQPQDIQQNQTTAQQDATQTQNTTQDVSPQTSQQTTQSQKAEQPTDDLLVEITAKDGKSKKLSGDDTMKVKPEEEVTIEIDLENKAATTKDVEIEIDTNDLDQDEEDSVTMKAGDSEQLDYTFEIPRLTEDDEYPIDIFVTDEKQTREWNLLLKVDKPSHEINIRTASFNPNPVPCNENTAILAVKLENTGKDDEEGKLRIDGGKLGITEWPFALSEGEAKLFKQTYDELTAGEYPFVIKVDYGSRTAEKKITLTVVACTAETTTQAKVIQEETKVIQAEKKISAINIIQPEEDVEISDMMHGAVVLLAGIFALLMIVTMIKVMRR